MHSIDANYKLTKCHKSRSPWKLQRSGVLVLWCGGGAVLAAVADTQSAVGAALGRNM